MVSLVSLADLVGHGHKFETYEDENQFHQEIPTRALENEVDFSAIIRVIIENLFSLVHWLFGFFFTGQFQTIQHSTHC